MISDIDIIPTELVKYEMFFDIYDATGWIFLSHRKKESRKANDVPVVCRVAKVQVNQTASSLTPENCSLKISFI
ncbi:hypothetical protein T07_133 [Trichinella nelsoni]|uniref:Uncharacterized protein n=1 Tax=Trichinella nelsoni TaxID=6336 RepID=A0A0V0RZ52_9BILA|nr:hypothetical protein T07_133 [Trichinella nelsoni]